MADERDTLTRCSVCDLLSPRAAHGKRRRKCANCKAEQHRRRNQRRRAARRAAGVCIWCAVRRPVPSLAGCEECLRRRAEGIKAPLARLRATRRAAGACISCGVRAAPSRTRCYRCLRRAAQSHKRNYRSDRQRKQKRLDAGQCPRCTAPLAVGRTLCRPCLSDRRVGRLTRKKKWAGSGRCMKCGGPRDTPTLRQCARCRIQGYRYKRAYLLAGLCPCGQFRAPGKASCARCLTYRRDAQRRRRAVKREESLHG